MLKLEDILPVIHEEQITDELNVIAKELMEELDFPTAVAFTTVLMSQTTTSLKMFWLGYNLHRAQQKAKESTELERMFKKEL